MHINPGLGHYYANSAASDNVQRMDGGWGLVALSGGGKSNYRHTYD